MPRKEIDYSKTIIYKIQHEDNEELIYVGHTTAFIKRKNVHKSLCYNESRTDYNSKVYQMIRANGGWECFKMIMIEEYPCSNKLEACKREDECMRELNATMNTWRAVANEEETKEHQKQYNKKYWKEHKEEIISKKTYDRDKRIKHYQEHKEEISIRAKERYENNKEKINRIRREKRQLVKAIVNKN